MIDGSIDYKSKAEKERSYVNKCASGIETGWLDGVSSPQEELRLC